MVRAPGCGPGGRGFESHYSPHLHTVMLRKDTLGCRQVVRHGTLTPAFVGSNPATPAKTQYCDSLAQVVEHLTFNQGVRGSNPRRVTKKRTGRMASSFLDGDIRGGDSKGFPPPPVEEKRSGRRETPPRSAGKWRGESPAGHHVAMDFAAVIPPKPGRDFCCSVIAPLPHKGGSDRRERAFVGSYFPSRKICI